MKKIISFFVMTMMVSSLFASELSIGKQSATLDVQGMHLRVEFYTPQLVRVYATPADRLPVFVKAGTILPWGPEVQYSTEKKWDALEVRVYPGADGRFVLYEDENDNYNYEKGMYSTIDFSWDEATRTLTIGDRKGSFPGMLKSRTFSLVVATPSNAVADQDAVKTIAVRYSGKKKSVVLK